MGPHERMTRRTVKKVAWAGAKHSFAEASKDLQHQAGVEVSVAECARVAGEYGPRLDAMQREREKAWTAPWTPETKRAEPEKTVEQLVIEADATSVLTRADEEHKMVYCATAFDGKGRLKKGPPHERPMIVERRYSASGVEFEDFEERLKALAARMGVVRTALMAFIGDGAACLWLLAKRLFPHAVLIQDYWHVCEHLAKLVKELFGETERANQTVAKWKTALWESRLDEILADLEAEKRRRRGKKRERIEEEIRYMESARERMDYARFRREGWPIGSGAVEGTCKHLVKERYNVTGARWKRKNVPDVLALRLSIFNEEWETDWSNLKVA
jgi:hypothetical protein